MLSQSSVHLWEGYSSPGRAFRDSYVDKGRAGSCACPRGEWKAVSLQGRRRARRRSGRSGAVVSSQGIQAAPVEEERNAQGFARASQVRVDGDGAGRVSLRPPAPLPESGRLESEDTIGGAAAGAEGVESRSAVVQEDGKIQDAVSLERFARARAAGRELAQRNREAAGLGFGSEEGEYFEPKVGDYVTGIVTSGSFSRLDVEIGAREPGHLFRKDVMPLDKCSVREMSWEFSDDPPQGLRFVRDDEVLNLAMEAPLAVESGTVLTMQVKGISLSGRALLSARSVAREYAWQRVRQLHEYNAILEVEITEWTTAGLVSRIEGLRAFLPIHNLVNHAPEPATSGSVSYREYVGRKFTVMISNVYEERRSLVISEKKAWMTKNAYIGALVEGIVTQIQPYGVHIRMKNTDMSGVLHISNISQARVNNISSVFSIGEEVKVMVVPSSHSNRLSFSTVEFEKEHGLILRDKEGVFQDVEEIAAEIAKAYKSNQSESAVGDNDSVDVAGQKRVIANWEWLDFGDKTEVDQ